MAAMIEVRNGESSFVEYGLKERAWHGLGTTFDRPLTAKEALEGAHADFDVRLQPVFTADDFLLNLINGQQVMDSVNTKLIDGQQFINIDMLKSAMIEGKRATVRTDYNEPLGIVSDTYGVVQNADAFAFLDTFCNGATQNNPFIETAGVLGNGERIFVTAKFPEPIRVGAKDDNVEMYIVATTSHDGTGSVSILVTPIRVVCNNTLALAFKQNSGRLNFKHTINVNARMDLTNKQNAEMAYKTLKLYDTYKAYFEESMAALAKIKLNDTQIRNIVAETIMAKDAFKVYQKDGITSQELSTRSKNQFDAALASINSGVGQDIVEAGTGLWLLNGLTTHFQNGMNWKDEEKKFLSLTEGAASVKTQTAYDLILKAA